jgi:hypothetical protein
MAPPKRKETLSKEFLRECFLYNPETGECKWAMRPRHHFSSDAMMRRWEKTKLGKDVGCVIKNGSAKGYSYVKLDGKSWYLHRLIFTWMTGQQPFNVDHANLDRSDNRWCNLRNATLSQNSSNVRPRSATGYKGVSLERGVYRASIKHQGENIRLGRYSSAEDAAMAHDAAAKKYHGEFAFLNFGGDGHEVG